ncbi:MAG: hypothetical protein HGB11_10615 [Chlorobiales bacterium]|nr:hypothetical protein [Chlorobiales bacterium]
MKKIFSGAGKGVDMRARNSSNVEAEKNGLSGIDRFIWNEGRAKPLC